MRKLSRGPLVLATHNPGKVIEIAELLGPFGMDIIAAGALGLPEPEETGLTFRANAELKALAAAIASGLPALADDSGLCVDALDGEPGIYSARWAGPGKDFALAMHEVHTKMHEVHTKLPSGQPDSAHFICALCLAWPDGHTQSFEGRVDGRMVWPPRGNHGFGYDPMFLMDGRAQTYGEMARAEKEADNHRARAFTQLVSACLI